MNNFYKSKSWKKKREVILYISGYRCVECKRYGKSITADTIHHVFPRENFPELKLNNGNLIALCKKCHGEMHDKNNNKLTSKGIYYCRKQTAVIDSFFGGKIKNRLEVFIKENE